MPVVKKRNVLSGMQVKEAMQRQVVQLPQFVSIAACITRLLKFKNNAVLVTDAMGHPVGVVSKTDLIGAFYAGLPAETPLGDIMTGPLLTCFPDDELESSLDLMQARGVHRLYVTDAEAASLAGTLSYTDIVALLYRYCRACPKRIAHSAAALAPAEGPQRLSVKEVMTNGVVAFPPDALLAEVIEGLTAGRIGAVLIRGDGSNPSGVISKTDLIIAYLRAVPLDAPARTIMRSPVSVCDRQALLWEALRMMLLKDVQRLFVHAGDREQIIGVLSLSDAARIRSGTCRACMPSRIIMTG
jgi:CBS domain-containing protein